MELDFSGSGEFNIENRGNIYHGNLYLNPDQGGILLEIEVKNTGAPLSYGTLPLEIDYVTGELTSGFKLTLYKCSRLETQSFIGSRDVFTYSVQFMLEGIKISKLEEDKFSKVIFNMSDIILWGGISSYKINENLFNLSHTNDKNITIYSDNEYLIEYYVSGKMLPTHERELLVEEIKLTQIPVIIIESKKIQKFDFFLEKYYLIKRFIEIAIKKKIYPLAIKGFSPNKLFEGERKRNQYPINVNSYLIKNEEKANTKYLESHRYLFSLDDVINYGNFNKYVENYEKLEPIIDLYLDIIHGYDITVTRAFLNITQALETYHSRFKFNGKTSDFKKRIENVILEKRSKTMRDRDRKFLMANSKKFITLESRLAELLLAEFEIRFYTGAIPYDKFPKIIAKSRNYYTHYDENLRNKIIEKENLEPYIQILMCILEYYILDELGFSDSEFRRKKVLKSLESIKTGFDIRKAMG